MYLWINNIETTQRRRRKSNKNIIEYNKERENTMNRYNTLASRPNRSKSVSYTHLDVYKRQVLNIPLTIGKLSYSLFTSFVKVFWLTPWSHGILSNWFIVIINNLTHIVVSFSSYGIHCLIHLFLFGLCLKQLLIITLSNYCVWFYVVGPVHVRLYVIWLTTIYFILYSVFILNIVMSLWHVTKIVYYYVLHILYTFYTICLYNNTWFLI